MFQRRKRNLDLSGANEPIRNGQLTHGINWRRDQRQESGQQTDSTAERDLDYGWEEADEETDSQPERENLRQHPPKGQPELAFSDRENDKIARFQQPAPSYPGLQRKPVFNEQHKKLTVYVEKELLETIERLKKGRYIPSYSWLVAEAIRCYLREQDR